MNFGMFDLLPCGATIKKTPHEIAIKRFPKVYK